MYMYINVPQEEYLGHRFLNFEFGERQTSAFPHESVVIIQSLEQRLYDLFTRFARASKRDRSDSARVYIVVLQKTE